jgi:hypothetical protein
MRTLTVILALTMTAAAQLPDAPSTVRTRHPFTRTEKIGLTFEAGAQIADTVVTCRNLANGGHEYIYPTQDCARIAILEATQFAAVTFAVWILNRTDHPKIARTLPFIFGTSATLGATIH